MKAEIRRRQISLLITIPIPSPLQGSRKRKKRYGFFRLLSCLFIYVCHLFWKITGALAQERDFFLRERSIYNTFSD